MASSTTNQRIRRAMIDVGMSQGELADLLGISDTEVSYMLKYELAAKVQADIIAKIKNQAS